MVATQLDEETVKKVIRQVEFYFSDNNLPRDHFLRDTITQSEDGMVSIALICAFSRMRSHLGLGEIKAEDVSENIVNAVAEILKAKSTSLKISQDGKKVGRIVQLDSRTIAASPFQYDINQADVESFFKGQNVKINSMRLPRHVSNKRLFCGTILVEFSSEEEATRILAQTLHFRGAQLELKPEKEFDEQRVIEEEAENTRRDMLANSKNASQEEEYPEGLIVAFKLKSLSSKNGTEVNSSDVKPDSMELATESTGEESEPKVDEKRTDSDEVEEEKKESLLNGKKKTFADLYKDDNVVLREDLRSVFDKFGTVKYIDFKMGEESGFIRFKEADGAQKSLAAAVLTEEGGLIVKNYVAILDLVIGEAEKEYWNMVLNSNWNRGKKNRGKHNRSRDDNSGTRENKIQKATAA